MANVSVTRRMCNPVEPNALALQANWLWTGSDSFFFLFLLQFKTQFVELIASPTAAKSFLFSTSCVACSPNFKNICQTRTCFIYFGFSRYCACCCFRSYCCCCCCSCCCCCCMPMGDNVNGKCWALAPWSIVNNNCLLGIEHEPSSIWDYAASPVAVYRPVCRPPSCLRFVKIVTFFVIAAK